MKPVAWRQLRGLRALVFEAVEHGSRAVERVQKATADRPFNILEAVPLVAEPARVVHAIHDFSVSATHAAIRVVSHAVGQGIDVALDVAEKIDTERGGPP